jgi:superfamily II DNA or RNA helicase
MIKHVFKAEIAGHQEELFKDCNTLDTFLLQAKMLETDVKTEKLSQHAFESLVEALIFNKRLLNQYEVLSSAESDLMVHGKGINKDGQSATVVAIYVDNPYTPLTANVNHITTFLANSRAHYKIEPKKDSFFIFSNSVAVHEKTYAQFIEGMNLKDCVSLVMKADIEAMINGNKEFWDYFKNELVEPTDIVEQKITKSFCEEKKSLRKHQIKQLQAAKRNKIGIILSPTGTGKSITEAAIIEDEISKTKTPVCLICTPRIGLTEQLIRMTFEHLRDRNINAQYLSLNSGNLDADEFKKEMARHGLTVTDIPSTTSSDEVKEYYLKAKAAKVPFIIGATYQSAWKMKEIRVPIDVMICDEAHNLVSCIGRFSTEAKDEVRNLKADRKYFFTATAAYTDSPEGTGFQNEKLFGKQICVMSPKEAIEAGEIVPPYIHKVDIDICKIRNNLKLPLTDDNLDDRDIEDNIEVSAYLLADAYRQHRSKIKEKSVDPDKIGAKLLVVCKGEPSFVGLLNSETIKALKNEFPGLELYGISSASGAYINGSQRLENGYKHEFMRALRELPDEKDAIIFHIDMIGEGIDVSGISGVLTFRELGAIKSTQTLGRAMRLCNIDRAKLYNNEIKPCEFDKMVKPYAWVVIPICSLNQQDMESRMVELARDMRTQLGYLPFENASGEAMRGTPKETFSKEDHTFGKKPDEMRLLHLIDYPIFLRLAEQGIDKARNSKKALEIIKTVMVNGKVS